MTMPLPEFVKIVEVGPRDGLQNESKILPAAVKAEFINRLSGTGLCYIEAAAFVSPKWVPQMADSQAVFDAIEQNDSITYAALVPNEKGLESAIEAGVKEIAVFTAASEAFTKKNINCTIEESLARFAPVIARAAQQNMKVRGYVSCIAGCPYQGTVRPERVAEVAAKLYEAGCYEISLGDTIGVGTPPAIRQVIYDCVETIPVSALALHCHDTHGLALANIFVGLEMGVSVIDSAAGGLGGCPYASGASGNVATEDVLYMLDKLNIKTGVDLDKVLVAAAFILKALEKMPSSKVALARGT
jgi:hydroxymethylglutaryl-CoA lyase